MAENLRGVGLPVESSRVHIDRMPRVTPTDEQLRVFIYQEVITRGAVPSSAHMAEAFGVPAELVRGRLAQLCVGKTVLVDPTTHEPWMIGPFSAAPTNYRVTDGATSWFANCAWDMFGVATLVGRPVRAEARCVDCGETLAVDCDPRTAPREPYVVHFLLPARRWYDDIGFT